MPSAHIAVVTAFPPSRATLNEYGHHLVTALAAKPGVAQVTVLAEDLPEGDAYPHIEGVAFEEAWRLDGVTNPLRLARALRRLRPDAVIFNAHFSSFGTSRIGAAAGLLAPLLARAAGVRTITLLHNIVETVDLSRAGFGFGRVMERVMRAIGTVLTWLVLRSHVVTVTIPEYVEVLRSKYRAGNVALVPHGAFEVPPKPVFVEDRRQRVLAFGKFGTYKKVEDLIAAYKALAPARNLELVIAGTDSPNAPGYLSDVEQRLGGDGITFTGYVPEGDIPKLFGTAAVAVFPYTATTGSSGVLHQAGSYGCAAVLPNIGDFAAVIADEGYRGEFFEPNRRDDLARALACVLDHPEHRKALGRRNYLAARGLPIDEVADWYLLHAA